MTDERGSASTIKRLRLLSATITVAGGFVIPAVIYWISVTWASTPATVALTSAVGLCIALGTSLTSLAVSALLDFALAQYKPGIAILMVAVAVLFIGVNTLSGILARV